MVLGRSKLIGPKEKVTKECTLVVADPTKAHVVILYFLLVQLRSPMQQKKFVTAPHAKDPSRKSYILQCTTRTEKMKVGEDSGENFGANFLESDGEGRLRK